MDESEEQKAARPESGQLAKLALEFGPLLVFFLANQFGEDLFAVSKESKIFWATGAFMVATFIALTASKVLFGRIPTVPLVSGLFVGVFGGLTLWLQEELFIKLKPTIVNLLFAAILFGGLLSGRSLLKYLFGDVFRLREPGWRILTFRWACFFVLLAVLNEIIWRSFSTDFWAGFKLFGIMPLTMAFAVAQIGLLKRYETAEKEP
ncbi:MAG: septation protein A [Hyphomicrobiaceae bacterium]